MDMRELHRDVAEGRTSVQSIVKDSRARIGRDSSLGAWVSIRPGIDELARAQDKRRDLDRLPLSGVSVGVKDMFEVRGIPLHAGFVDQVFRHGDRNADLVQLLEDRGAIVIGSTSMPQLAFGPTPGARHPFSSRHTAGSSSTGSAIAVAAGHVSLAVGSQTNGSVIRPASFCGIVGFKPTQGAFSLGGVVTAAPSLEQPGFMTKTVDSMRYLWDVIAPPSDGEDPEEPAGRRRPPLLLRSRYLDVCEPEMRAVVEGIGESLGADELGVPEELDHAPRWIDLLVAQQMANFVAEHSIAWNRLSPQIRDSIHMVENTPEQEIMAAIRGREEIRAWMDDVLDRERCVLSPAALGPAPTLAEGAGSPAMSSLWSLGGTPAATVPVARTEEGLSLGMQICSAKGGDRAVLDLCQSIEASLIRG